MVIKKQSKCFQNEHILDFSDEHKLKVSKDMLEKYTIKIQIKKCQNYGVKSRILILIKISSLFSISDLILGELLLGLSEPGSCSAHYQEMLARPGEHVFMWHDSVQNKS